jgi:hypothetical protein
MIPSEVVRYFYDGASIQGIAARPECLYEVHEIELLLRGYMIGLRSGERPPVECPECGA